MTDPEQPAPEHVIQVPFLGPEQSVGLGDLVAKVTTSVGITPCEPCEKRRARMNAWVVIEPRKP